MIHPAPTSKIDPRLARGTLAQVVPASATRPGYLVATYPNTNYELHLHASGTVSTPVGKRLIGTIHVQARRIDETRSGGRFIEPVTGRPRRAQGTVLSVDEGANEVVIDAGVPIHVTPTDPRQKASGFQPGQFVGFDVLAGAEFREGN